MITELGVVRSTVGPSIMLPAASVPAGNSRLAAATMIPNEGNDPGMFRSRQGWANHPLEEEEWFALTVYGVKPSTNA